ncbi:MAG: hypothetical protein WBB25_13520 [Sulfitobacter sp.]
MPYASFEDGYLPSHLTSSIFAQWARVPAPNPCRKFHISSDIASAQAIADTCLPILRAHNLHHKVVESEVYLRKQAIGPQAGKFITIYTPVGGSGMPKVIDDLAEALAALEDSGQAHPCPSIPRFRPSGHVFAEAPRDERMFIYGGFVCNPYD